MTGAILGSAPARSAEQLPLDKRQALHQSQIAHQALQQSLTQQLKAIHMRQEQLRRASSDAIRTESQLRILHIRQESIEHALARTQTRLDLLNEQQEQLRRGENALRQAQINHALEAALLLPAAQKLHNVADLPLFWPPPPFGALPQSAMPGAPTAEETTLALALLRAEGIFTQQEAAHLAAARQALYERQTALAETTTQLQQQHNAEEQGKAESQDLTQQAVEAHQHAQQTLEDAKKMLAEARKNADALNEEITHLAFQEKETRRYLTSKARALKKAHKKEEAEHLTREANALNTGKGVGWKRGATPVEGILFTHWGERTDAGTATGLTYKASAEAVIHAPCTGRLLFAGTFRSFGQMVILDCGHHQRFVLSGFGKITTHVGESVQRGGTLGHMPTSGGLLFIQLHHDKYLLDPTPYFESSTTSPPSHSKTQKETVPP